MAWDNSFIDNLKLQVNIVDVIGREVNLKKSGANYKGLCPFHNEKTPSFMVNEEKQIFNCFGCGEKGDVIKFTEAYYKLPFMEAVEKLCNEYGIKMPEKRSSGPKIDYDKYYEINAKAARYYYDCLTKNKNKGLYYLQSRGLNKDTIVKFGLGYAPDGWNGLVNHLRAEKIDDDDILKLGLAKKGKQDLYDKFRDRVIFPIINTQGKVIGFGARAIEDIKPKYLNSDESEIFLKKNNLFGLNLSRKEITEADRAIIVEGYMDVISLYQNGVRNVAASLGTALTENQVKLLCRYSKNIVLSYDSDGAGIKAALRGIDVVNTAGGKPKVMVVSDGKDPDEFIKAHGKANFEKLADEAIPGTEFILKQYRNGFNLSKDTDILAYIERIVPVLKKLGPIEEDIYVKKLSEEFNISEHAIHMAVQTENAGKSIRVKPPRTRKNAIESKRDIKIEMSLLVLAYNNTNYLRRIREDGIVFHSELARKILSVEESLDADNSNGTHRIDEKLIFRSLEPDEESIFANYVNTIKLGPDDEAFYKETRAGYLISQFRDERVELLNEIAIAEKFDRSDELKVLATRLIEIDSLIKKYTEGKDV